MRRFIDKGYDIEQRNYVSLLRLQLPVTIFNPDNFQHFHQSGHTALIIAAEYGHFEIVKMLLAEGANIDATNEVGTHSFASLITRI